MNSTVSVDIELFGTARMACGRRQLEARLPPRATTADVAIALSEVGPALIGVALREDLSGLLESYALNLNATDFVEGDELTLKEGDILLLFSSQAGG